MAIWRRAARASPRTGGLEGASGDLEAALDRASGGEGPTRSTLGLVLNGGHLAIQSMSVGRSSVSRAFLVEKSRLLIGAVGLAVGLGEFREFGPEGLCTVTRGEWGPV